MDWSISFASPWWLLVLLLLPAAVCQSVGGLSGLGRYRSKVAIALRLALFLLLIAALADLRIVRKSERLCTLFVLDQSQSIPAQKSEDALESIMTAIRQRPHDDDLAGLIVFGKEARIEMPPTEYSRQRETPSVGSIIDREHSDIAAGIKLALGSFPPDAGKRIVLFSDGNQNRGNALAQAAIARRSKVSIDVVPIEYRYDNEILVDKLSLPADLKEGEPANLKIVVRSSRPAAGTLRLNRVAEGDVRTILEQRVELREGVNVFTVTQRIDEPNFYSYEATFESDVVLAGKAPGQGDSPWNNRASGFLWVRGRGRILLIEPTLGAEKHLADKLRQDQIAVVSRTPDQVKENLADLRQYDAVMVCNVPAEAIGEKLQDVLATNTRELGAGLIMTGGPNSFGAGGYRGSALEKALPVDMDVPATKIRGKGALVLIMHACEIPEGNFWQKKIAQLAIGMLGNQDECGLLYWSGTDSWLFTLQEVGPARERMNKRIDGMTPGDMPDFDPAMRMAVSALAKSDAMTKHVIIISDGDPQAPAAAVLNAYRDSKVTCTTVAVAAHGFIEESLMRRIAQITRGRYHQVKNPNTLPRIYIEETRIVSRPLIYEQADPWSPIIRTSVPAVAGMPRELPGIKGYVLTTAKPTAEVAAVSPIPTAAEPSPILAQWQFGLGKAVAFTSDTGSQWAVNWPNTDLFGRFWTQVVRWAMRPPESEQLTVSTQEKDGIVRVVVDALDKKSEFLNFLKLKGALVRPDMSSNPVELRQTAPGKYEGEFPVGEAGSYFLRIGYQQPDGLAGSISTGVSVSYPAEYRDLESNRDLLLNIASITGGQVVDFNKADQHDYFRRDQPPTEHPQPAWPLLLLAALVLLFIDVANRRIAISPADIAEKYRRWRSRTPAPVQSIATMERLRGKKSEVGEDIERSRQRFEPTTPPTATESRRSSEPTAPSIPSAPTQPPPTMTPKPPAENPEDASYTSRLLRAKKKVWEERDKEDEKPT